MRAQVQELQLALTEVPAVPEGALEAGKQPVDRDPGGHLARAKTAEEQLTSSRAELATVTRQLHEMQLRCETAEELVTTLSAKRQPQTQREAESVSSASIEAPQPKFTAKVCVAIEACHPN